LNWHIHSWQAKDLDIYKNVKYISIKENIEEVSNIETKLCYNMKEWGKYYVYPSKYRGAGLVFTKSDIEF